MSGRSAFQSLTVLGKKDIRVVSSLAVPGSIPLHMSTVAIKIDSVAVSKK